MAELQYQPTPEWVDTIISAGSILVHHRTTHPSLRLPDSLEATEAGLIHIHTCGQRR